MTTKREAVYACANTLKKQYVSEFYERYLLSRDQGDTVATLLEGVNNRNLTLEDALNVALLVGIQWGDKFEGTP